MSNIETPWGPLGYVVFKRTYARRIEEDKLDTETFYQTVNRCVEAFRNQLNVGFTAEEEQDVREMLLGLEGSIAGRFWWQLGTKTVNKLGLLSLQNCAFTTVDDPIEPFTWAMDALMLGCGVGFNIQKEHIFGLPKVKEARAIRLDTKDADFIVPDSREGWVKLLKMTLEAHFITGKDFTYSTICIRGKGAQLQGFGGTAAGPEELCWGMNKINEVLNARAGKKARPIDALDIMDIIAYVVVAGNIRRSALIAIGDADDLQYLSAKNWGEGNIPNWRATSNNSVVCNNIKLLPDQFWKGYNGNGEPYGLINLKLAKSCGRLGETQYSDKNISGFNPCAEQGLEDKETCCLAEIFLPNIKSKERLITVAKHLYRICKHSLTLPCHLEGTEKIVHKNMRMGIGVTGYLQATEEQRSWLSDTYVELRKFDKQYSKQHGFPESIKLTTVKPSGTLSLLAGVTSGVHPGFAQYFIRRIRMASDSPLVTLCRSKGYFIEFQKNLDGSDDKNTVVVEFPCAYPKGTVLTRDLTAVKQLEYVKRLQTEWSDNSVSCTVYYKQEELPEIQEWLKKNYNSSVKTVSFLLHSGHGFAQAPLEEISEEEYKKLVAKVGRIDDGDFGDDGVAMNLECVSGACPVK